MAGRSVRSGALTLAIWAAAVASVLAHAAPVAAQAGGTIAGRVVDETNLILPGVTVELTNADEGMEIETVTDMDGTYRFVNVPPGVAQISFKLVNFATVRSDVTVVDGRTTTVDALMKLSLTADITITAPRLFRSLADVANPTESLIGIASSASEGAITAAQLEMLPLMRSAEVLQTVPGMIISQHSGEGKANQYYLRSFNLDHGSDFATTVAGAPVNMPTHAHAQGYSDANFLISELVSGVQYRKGPYYAEEGDFSVAGSANINYVNRLDRPLISLGAGTHGWGRVLGAASPRVGDGFLLAGLELNRNSGPWERPDGYGRINGIVRYSRGDSRNGFSLTGMGYSADWDSTDQVPLRAIDSGLITRFGNIDPTDGGHSSRYTAVADYQHSGVKHSTRTTAYVIRYGMTLFQNFTYLLDNPVDGDQFEQVDRRTVSGARVSYRRMGHFGTLHNESAFGVDVRHDAIDIGLFRTAGRQRLSTTRTDAIGQTSVGVFGRSEIEWSRMLRTTVGLRGDVYSFDVAANNPLNSGTASKGILSPKLTTVIGPWSGTEVYVNAGLGFHSNHGLGVTLRVDPETGEPADPIPPLVRARGAEVGLRTIRIPKVQSTLAVWVLGFDSELLFIGDTGTTEASRPSRRWGVEWTNYARPRDWLSLELDVSLSNSRFTDDDPAGDAIPGALSRVISAGATVDGARDRPRGWFGSVQLRHFGPRALVEDRSVTSAQTTIFNGELGYRLNPRTRLVVEAFNLFDARVADIDYYYTSRLRGEPEGGIADIHTHPAIPRSARLVLRVAF
jgi:hypothetical protein